MGDELKPEDMALIERHGGSQDSWAGRWHITSADLSALLDAARAQGPGPGEAVAWKAGDRVIYTMDDDNGKWTLHGTIVRPVEGWWEIRFRDDSTAIVRPSRIAATPTREAGNQGSSQGCGTGHSGEQLEPAVGATAALAPNVTWLGRGDYEPTESMIEAGEWHNHRHNGNKRMIASFKAMMVQAEIDGLVRYHPQKGGEG